MTDNMREFVKYLIAGLVSKGVLKETETAPSYVFDGSTLTIFSDDGSLTHSWDWEKMQYDVEAKA